VATFPFSTHIEPASATYRDAKGNTGVFRFFVSWTDAAATRDDLASQIGSVVTAYSALTNAALQSIKGGGAGEYGVAQYGAHASGGAYESIVEKAVMVFQDASGTLHRYEVMAPKIAIFEADKVTVNPAGTGVATFISAMSTAGTHNVQLCSRSGILLTNYMGGFFRARKIRRRLNVLVLQPDLTASLPAE
jgi:hypothetical protein